MIGCRYRFDKDFIPQEKSVSVAMNFYGVDTNWYTDTGATNHVTGDLNRLSVHDKYNGGDHIRMASGVAMHINRVGHAIVTTPSRQLHLRNVLHVP